MLKNSMLDIVQEKCVKGNMNSKMLILLSNLLEEVVHPNSMLRHSKLTIKYQLYNIIKCEIIFHLEGLFNVHYMEFKVSMITCFCVAL